MTNIMADGATWLADQQQAHLATEITYRRGGSSLSISATKGASGHQLDQQTGVISWFDQDWLIPTSVLTLGEPVTGDKIEIDTEVFEVLPPAGEESWRWSDNHKTIYRIHTKRIVA